MLARRLNGLHPINRMRDEVDRLFDDMFEGFPRTTFGTCSALTFPALNVWEDDDNVYAEAELPGLKLDDVELLIMGDELAIKGERKDADKDDVSYHRKERASGRFSRVLRLPVDVDPDGVEATLRDGVLKVTMPKVEAAKPRKVEVKALAK